MEPSRKRTLRLTIALGCALVLSAALVYTSFGASSEARQPSELATAEAGVVYQLTGKVVDGSVRRSAEHLTFAVRDRTGGGSVPVRYSGVVPDPFREGREVIVNVSKQGDVFVGERDTLITKCPSKFTSAESASAESAR